MILHEIFLKSVVTYTHLKLPKYFKFKALQYLQLLGLIV